MRSRSVVVLVTEVRDEVFADHPAKRVLQLDQLNEEIVLGRERRRGLRRLEVEREPLLDAAEVRAPCQIHEKREIEHDRRGKDRIAAEEVHLDLHRVAEPSEE